MVFSPGMYFKMAKATPPIFKTPHGWFMPLLKKEKEKEMKEKCAECNLQHRRVCNHNYPTPCVHCKHREDKHFESDKGQCGICNCEGFED